MKKSRGNLLPLVAFIALAAASASASTPAPAVPGAKTPAPASRTQTLKPVPEVASEARPADPLHLFTVNDEKGLLLTCVAPDLDTNIDTDVFKSCTLAPGRTLDDMMHTFIRGIHYEQSQHQKEHDAWAKELEERTAQKPAVKP